MYFVNICVQMNPITILLNNFGIQVGRSLCFICIYLKKKTTTDDRSSKLRHISTDLLFRRDYYSVCVIF